VKTLTANVAAKCKAQGNQPRFFVRIPDANLFLAIKEFTDAGTAEAYTDCIQRIGTIRHDMDWLGGMGSVSGLDMSSIQLGERVTLCSEASQSPVPQTSSGTYYAGAGRLLAQGSTAESFADVRNAITAQYAEGTLVVGTAYNAGNDWYVVYRSILQFRVPSDLTTCEDAYLEFPGAGNYHAAAFAVHVVPGTWPNFTDAPGLFDDFTGHAASGPYTLTDWNESWTTAEYDTTCRIRLNATARTWMESNPNGIMRIMLISERDRAGTPGPSGNDFVQFSAGTAKLNIRYNSKTLENADATIYLDYESTSITYTGMQSIRKYLVDDYAIGDAALDLKLRDNNFRHDPMIPAKTINTDDWPDCPEENIGKAVPVVYGDFALTAEHRPGVGNFYGYGPLGTQIDFSYPDAFAAPVVKVLDDDMAALPTLLLLKSGNTALHLWNQSAKTFTLFPVRTSVAIYTSGKGTYRDITEDSDTAHIPPVLCETIYKGVATVIPNGNESTTITNPTYAYDTDTDTYAVMTADSSELILYFQDPDGITTDGAVVFVVYAEFKSGATATKLDLTVERNKSDDPASPSWQLVETTNPWTADGQGFYAFYVLDASNLRTRLVLSQYRIRLTRATDSTGSVNLYDACALVAYSVQSPTVLYMSGQGHYDDGSGTVTGTASLLIENPSHVIESLARDQMSLATADINTTAFDTAATALTAWKYAFQISEQKKASAYLHDLAAQCKARVFWDSDDKLIIKVFDADAYFPKSGTNVPTGFDIFDTTGTPSGGSFTTNPILPNSLKIDRVSMDEVYNDFVLKYRKNYASNEYAEMLYMTNGAGTAGSVETNISESDLENSQTLDTLKSLCADNYTLYGATRTLTFEAWAIRDTATATKLLQYLIERTSERRYKVTLTTKMTAIGHELGDFINIRDARVVDLFGTATAYIKKWEIVEINQNLDNCEITITAVEV